VQTVRIVIVNGNFYKEGYDMFCVRFASVCYPLSGRAFLVSTCRGQQYKQLPSASPLKAWKIKIACKTARRTEQGRWRQAREENAHTIPPGARGMQLYPAPLRL